MCKICKLGLADLVDHLLEKGWSYRRIAKHIISEYHIPVSRMSIARYVKHRRDESSTEHNNTRERTRVFLGLSAKPVRRSYC